MVEMGYGKSVPSWSQKACPMNDTNTKECNHLTASDGEHLAIINNQAIPLAGFKPMAPYTLGTNEPWPDQGLNRVLATIESINADELNEIDCLEMLFYLSSKRQDARQLAEVAIFTYGSLAKVFQRPSKELRERLGVDHSVTALLAIAKSSMKFILAPEVSDRQELPSYAALMDYLALDLRGAEQEILRVLYLDTKNKIIKDEEMARGTVDTVSIHPKEVAKRALAYCASSVILAHNHLGDDPTPSSDDIKATVQTQGALQLIDVILHDHVVIARKRCFSMQQQGLI